MKLQLQLLIAQAIERLNQEGKFDYLISAKDIPIERTRSPEHGDFATNLALANAKKLNLNPRDLAAWVIEALPKAAILQKAEIAGPGFINFFLKSGSENRVVLDIFEQGDSFGFSDLGAGKRVQVEYVSANPTGPLHVGHGRGAAYGSCVASLLKATGHRVETEYYLNDAGRQMDILAVSLWLRYLLAIGEKFTFPDNCYQGDYLVTAAAQLAEDYGQQFHILGEVLFAGLEQPGPDHKQQQEHYLDNLIHRGKATLGEENFAIIHAAGMEVIVADIKQDLGEFSVEFDRWFAESDLVADGSLEQALATLKESGHLFEDDGATWFRSTDFGDSKDRVVIRDNGEPTYFATDIAYHLNKLNRGYDLLINIWGADHHGYVPRVKAAMQALGRRPEQLEVLLVQFAALYRAGEKLSMSTRSGEFVTLRELRNEVGKDAARFFYLQRKSDQHLDFDLDLAKSRSNENPVYYVQYAHARICSVFRQLEEKRIGFAQLEHLADLQVLTETHETDLISKLGRYPEVIAQAAQNLEPHQLAYYLRELATEFHGYYNAHAFLVDDAGVRNARLTLISAVRQVLANGLLLLGVSAPESM